jgi:hypothetical protein
MSMLRVLANGRIARFVALVASITMHAITCPAQQQVYATPLSSGFSDVFLVS